MTGQRYPESLDKHREGTAWPKGRNSVWRVPSAGLLSPSGLQLNAQQIFLMLPPTSMAPSKSLSWALGLSSSLAPGQKSPMLKPSAAPPTRIFPLLLPPLNDFHSWALDVCLETCLAAWMKQKSSWGFLAQSATGSLISYLHCSLGCAETAQTPQPQTHPNPQSPRADSLLCKHHSGSDGPWARGSQSCPTCS